MNEPAADGPVTVGVLYPAEWNADYDTHVERLAALDPRVEVLAEPYSEPEESRSGRGVPPYDDVRDLAPALSDAQRDVFGRMDCCIAIDLPFGVATVAPRLRWVQAVGAGVAQLQSAGLDEAGIELTNAGGVTSTAIAEFVMARILGEFKRVRELDEMQQRHEWRSVFGQQLAGRTVVLLGFGPINQEVAVRARAFGLHVVAMRRSAEPSPLVDEMVGPDDLLETLGRADIVVCALPETPATDNLLDRTALGAIKRGAVLVNVGRGTLIDEDAMADVLRAGQLRAAAIDVARIEPLPADSPLWAAPNIYLSAHCSTDPSRLFENLHELFEDNVRRFLAGEPLRNVVPPP